jgi:AraC-like DNA-binding protein
MTAITGASIWNMIILLGALQGYVLCTLLFFSKKNNKLSNRLLATLILLMTLACTNLYMTESWYTTSQLVQILNQVFPWILAMPLGPLIYFYVQTLLKPDFRLIRPQKWHFSTVFIDLVPYIITWVFIAGLLTGLFQHEDGRGWGDFIDSYNTYSDIPRWLSLTLYLLLTKRFLKRMTSDQSSSLISDARVKARLKWINQFLNSFLIFQSIWFIFLIPYIIPSTRGPLLDNMSYYPIYIPLAILIYGLGLKGYLLTQIPEPELEPAGKEVELQPGPQKVAVSALSFSSEEAANCIAILKKVMEKDKLYLEPALNLSAVSAHTHIPQKSISFILNNHLNKSFNEFINEYRIEEVKKRLLEKGNEHLTIAGLALECGFNSQATFQRSFKNATGVSPKEYLSLQPQKMA